MSNKSGIAKGVGGLAKDQPMFSSRAAAEDVLAKSDAELEDAIAASRAEGPRAKRRRYQRMTPGQLRSAARLTLSQLPA